ncbi:MAG: NAD(P)H-hydrate dehydratase [Spirochaetota bacterium]
MAAASSALLAQAVNILSIADMQALDRSVIADGMPSLLLMEHAAAGMFRHVIRYARRGRSIIICGTGNNGGDGLALARLLVRSDVAADVLVIGTREHLSADARTNLSLLSSEGVDAAFIDETSVDDACRRILSSAVMVDALFGTGVDRNIEGVPKRMVEAMNASKGIRISLDIPSGLPAIGSGSVCVKADHTITVGAPKDIFFLEPYTRFIGRLSVVPSMFPRERLRKPGAPMLLSARGFSKINCPDDAFASKRSASVCIIAGSEQYPGAAVLAASAVYRLGVGYIRLLVPYAIRDDIRKRLPPEVVTVGVGRKGDGHFSAPHIPQIEKEMKHARAVLIGCGVDRHAETGDLLNALVPRIDRPLVVDADGLYFISRNKELMPKLSSSTVLTPHVDEFSRLVDIPADEIQSDAFNKLAAFRERTKAGVVLKSAVTFISDDAGIAVHARPQYGMGKAGMGDVLAGIITGLLARGFSMHDAMTLGVYAHGKAFRIMRTRSSADEIQPSDVSRAVGHALRSIRTRIIK